MRDLTRVDPVLALARALRDTFRRYTDGCMAHATWTAHRRHLEGRARAQGVLGQVIALLAAGVDDDRDAPPAPWTRHVDDDGIEYRHPRGWRIWPTALGPVALLDPEGHVVAAPGGGAFGTVDEAAAHVDAAPQTPRANRLNAEKD